MKLDIKVAKEFLASVLQGHEKIDSQLYQYINPEFFALEDQGGTESYVWIAKILQDRKWITFPFDLVDQFLLSIDDTEKRTKFRNQIYNLYVHQLSFVEDASRLFKGYIAHCTITSGIKEALENYNRTDRIDYLLKELRKSVSKSEEILVGDKLLMVDYVENYEERQKLRKEMRDNPGLNPVIKTGIAGLDDQFQFRAPMLVDFLAPFKRYKSIFLNSMGFASLLQGFNVLHVTYENTIELTNNRYDAMFSLLDYNRISNLYITQAEKEALDSTFNWMKQWPNRLKIMKCLSKKTTVPEISEFTERLMDRENWKPDVVIVDYLNLVAPSTPEREERLQQGKVVWDLKEYADKYGVLVFEASQANMGGAVSDRIQLDHRGKSIDISQGINTSIAINQTKEEKAAGIIVLEPQFSRDFQISKPEIPLDSDITKMLVSRELPNLWQDALRVNPFRT